MALKGGAHPNWKGDMASSHAKRMRAVRKFAIDNCERCSDKATDRHHVDGNTGNNERSNVMFLCRKCHMEIDGRTAILHSRPRPLLPATACQVCGELHRRQRQGRCHACNEFYRRNGVERSVLHPVHRHFTKEQVAYLVEQRIAGESYIGIASKTGFSRMTISKVCRHELPVLEGGI